jgi:hypothetical protein
LNSWSNLNQITFGEQPFNFFPTHGKIRITFQQRPDAMEIIRQQTDCRRGEGEPNLHIYPCRSKEHSSFVGCEDRQAVVCNYREEVDAACGMQSGILRHGLILSPGLKWCVTDALYVLLWYFSPQSKGNRIFKDLSAHWELYNHHSREVLSNSIFIYIQA